MTPDAFSSLAARLSPAVKPCRVLDAVQFRVGGKAFATLGWPEPGWAVVKLSRRDQARLVANHPAASMEPGSQGRPGVTLLWLEDLDEVALADILALAWKEAYVTDRPARRGGRPRAADRGAPSASRPAG